MLLIKMKQQDLLHDSRSKNMSDSIAYFMTAYTI